MPKARTRARLALTDTTFRDAHQSLIGGHLRGDDIVKLAAQLDDAGFYSFEAFGGATFESEIRLNGEDPWEYLRQLDAVTPKTPLQALIRGQNLVANRNFADDAVTLFITYAAKCGVDIFRIFDPLNDLRNMETAIKAAKKAKKRVQGALCYAISPVHNLELWASLAKGIEKLGCDAVVIKDTSGLLSPQTTWELVAALRESVAIPIVVHSHCSSGMAPMAYMAAVEAGASVLDTALSPLAWGASQPAAESVIAALAGGDYDTGLDLNKLAAVKVELEALKRRYLEFLSPAADRVDSDILRYQVPGQVLEDIHHQLEKHMAGERLQEVLAEIPRVRQELGYPPLVAPLRQMIASQAVLNILGGDRYATVTKELKDYLQGLYGRPPVPADAEIRKLVLGREEPITIRPADLLKPQVPGARAELKKLGFPATDDQVLTFLLFPSLALNLFRGELGGKPEQEVLEKPSGEQAPEVATAPEPAPSSAEASAPAIQTAEFQVEVEGETYTVRVTGVGMSVSATQSGAVPAGAGASPVPAAGGPGTIVAPMQGLIVKMPVKVGDEVKIGDTVAVLEAMKMQNDITASSGGQVQAVHVKEGEVVTPNQPLLTIL